MSSSVLSVVDLLPSMSCVRASITKKADSAPHAVDGPNPAGLRGGDLVRVQPPRDPRRGRRFDLIQDAADDFEFLLRRRQPYDVVSGQLDGLVLDQFPVPRPVGRDQPPAEPVRGALQENACFRLSSLAGSSVLLQNAISLPIVSTPVNRREIPVDLPRDCGHYRIGASAAGQPGEMRSVDCERGFRTLQ